MVLSQGVHNLVGSRTAVVDVAENMQLVDGQTLYDVTDSRDEIVSATGGYNRIDNDADVGGFVAVAETLVEQFLDDV